MAWLRRNLFWPNKHWTKIHASFRHGSLQKCLYSKQRKVMKQPFHPPWLEQRTTQSLHGKAERKKPSLDCTLHSISLEKTTQQFNPTESGRNSKGSHSFFTKQHVVSLFQPHHPVLPSNDKWSPCSPAPLPPNVPAPRRLVLCAAAKAASCPECTHNLQEIFLGIGRFALLHSKAYTESWASLPIASLTSF